MFKFHFKGYAACEDAYYYSSDNPVDVTVFADNRASAIEKAEKVLGEAIHKGTMTVIITEVVCPKCGNVLEEGAGR